MHRALLGLFWLLLFFPLPLLAAPQVVTTIKPIDDLVRAVMANVAEPVRLIPPGASPHTYALKPSDRQVLAQADLLIWVGPEIESALPKIIKTLPPRVRIVTLKELPGVERLPAREGGAWEGHDHGHDGHRHHSHGKGQAAEAIDGHLWLSPHNAIAIVQGVAAILRERDPVHGAIYEANARAAVARLQALDRELKERLAPVVDRPFIVFHDAYQYFEKAYGLQAVGSVVIHPEQAPGAKRVAAIREKIAGLGALCVFAEPQFEPKLVHTLIEGSRARHGVLDPLGVDLPAGLEGYEALLRRLATALVECLS